MNEIEIITASDNNTPSFLKRTCDSLNNFSFKLFDYFFGKQRNKKLVESLLTKYNYCFRTLDDFLFVYDDIVGVAFEVKRNSVRNEYKQQFNEMSMLNLDQKDKKILDIMESGLLTLEEINKNLVFEATTERKIDQRELLKLNLIQLEKICDRFVDILNAIKSGESLNEPLLPSNIFNKNLKSNFN